MNTILINCVSGIHCVCDEPPSAKVAACTDAQLISNLICNVLLHITHFANRLMQCRQSTGAGRPNHPALHPFLNKRLAGFLENLRASNTCNEMLDAVKIKDVNDFAKECRTGRLDQTNVSFSNTPASMDTACQCTITSMITNNFNNNNVWKRKLAHQRFRNYIISLSSMPQYFLQKLQLSTIYRITILPQTRFVGNIV